MFKRCESVGPEVLPIWWTMCESGGAAASKQERTTEKHDLSRCLTADECRYVPRPCAGNNRGAGLRKIMNAHTHTGAKQGLPTNTRTNQLPISNPVRATCRCQMYATAESIHCSSVIHSRIYVRTGQALQGMPRQPSLPSRQTANYTNAKPSRHTKMPDRELREDRTTTAKLLHFPKA